MLRIAYWCGVSNLVVLAAVAWSFDYRPLHSITEALLSQGAVADRVDLSPSAFVTVAPGERKMALPVTVIGRSDTGPAEVLAKNLAVSNAGNEVVSFAAPEGIANTEPPKMAPVLRRNPATGVLEIGNFKPLSFAGTVADCEAIGRSMLEDAGSAASALEVLAASGQVSAARICAANGSVVITCRGGQVTVSPRRARPDDKCERLG